MDQQDVEVHAIEQDFYAGGQATQRYTTAGWRW